MDRMVGLHEARARGVQIGNERVEELPDGSVKCTFPPEIIIEAADHEAAQIASYLITAAKVLLDGDFSCGETPEVIPEDPSELEEMTPLEREELKLGFSTLTGGYATAAAIAAKATQRRRWLYGLSKYWLSLRTCSVAAIEHHPRYGNRFTVERDPLAHVAMAQAITAAYSVLEELGMQVKASRDTPSTINGQWNPPVLRDLKARLGKGGVDLAHPVTWIIRNPPTRIERRKPPPPGARASWAGYSIRDRRVAPADAIAYASHLRSSVSAHASSSSTRSLTMHDVVNVQQLARRLLLEAMGFWKPLLRAKRRRAAAFKGQGARAAPRRSGSPRPPASLG